MYASLNVANMKNLFWVYQRQNNVIPTSCSFFYWNAYHFALLLHCKGFQSIASSNKAKGFTF